MPHRGGSCTPLKGYGSGGGGGRIGGPGGSCGTGGIFTGGGGGSFGVGTGSGGGAVMAGGEAASWCGVARDGADRRGGRRERPRRSCRSRDRARARRGDGVPELGVPRPDRDRPANPLRALLLHRC